MLRKPFERCLAFGAGTFLLACGNPAASGPARASTGGASSVAAGGTSASAGAQTTNGGQVAANGGAGTTGAGGTTTALGGAPPQSGGSGGATSSGSGGTSSGGAGGAQQGGSSGSAGKASTGGSAGGGGVSTSGGAASGGASAGCPRACGPTFDQFFDEKKLATLRVKYSGNLPAYSAADHCAPYTWTSTQMVYESPDGVGNITLDNVGFRHRGSRAQPVQGFKLDVQTLDTPGAAGKRRFADLNRVNILSNEGDHTHILQCVGYKALNAFGVPAPRCNLMKVYLNDTYYGLLENVEQVNKGFLRRHFGSNKGNLYGASMSGDGGTKSGGMCTGGFQDSAAKLAYTNDTWSSYSSQYQLTSATSTTAQADLIPMLKCGATASDTDFQACIGDWIDVTEWLKVIAVESVLPELQSFIGYQRNYYLFFKPDTASSHQGRFVVWPWDLDTSMNTDKCSPSNCDVLTSVDSLYLGSRPKLVTRLTTVYRAEYCTQLKAFLANVFKPSLVQDFATVAQPGMTNDPTDNTSAWQTAASALTNYVTTRATAAQTAITTACP